jgi:hypothetical protein
MAFSLLGWELFGDKTLCHDRFFWESFFFAELTAHYRLWTVSKWKDAKTAGPLAVIAGKRWQQERGIMNIVAILILLVLLTAVVVIEFRIRKGKRTLVRTYSYRHIFRFGLITVFIGVFIALATYYFTGSFDAFITITVMTIVFALVGGLKIFLLEYNIKCRGGKKADWPQNVYAGVNVQFLEILSNISDYAAVFFSAFFSAISAPSAVNRFSSHLLFIFLPLLVATSRYRFWLPLLVAVLQA